MFPHWAIDASMGVRGGLFCFVPIEDFETPGDFTVIWGMNFLSDVPPDGGVLVGVLHPDGNEAAQAFIDTHADALEEMKHAMAESAGS